MEVPVLAAAADLLMAGIQVVAGWLSSLLPYVVTVQFNFIAVIVVDGYQVPVRITASDT